MRDRRAESPTTIALRADYHTVAEKGPYLAIYTKTQFVTTVSTGDIRSF